MQKREYKIVQAASLKDATEVSNQLTSEGWRVDPSRSYQRAENDFHIVAFRETEVAKA